MLVIPYFFKSKTKSLFFVLVIILSVSCKNKKQEYVEAKKEHVLASSELIPDDHFLGDKACAECHLNELKEWTGSHHDKAMQIATDETILGNFDDATFASQGVKSKFFKTEAGYYVNTEGPDGEHHE